MVEIKDEASIPGRLVVAPVLDVEVRLFRKLVSTDDNDVGVVVAAGDTRSCSEPGTVETSCDSADCTPVPVDAPAACAVAAA